MALVAGGRAKGSDFQNLEMRDHSPLDSGTFTSTTYTTTRTGGTSPVGFSFVAPPSGKIVVHWAAGLLNNGAGFTLCSFKISAGAVLGSGTIFQDFSDANNIGNVGTGTIDRGSARAFSGLTPGNDYNIVLGYRVSSGTGTALRVAVIVVPCIA